MGFPAAPGSHELGGQSDQYTGDLAGRLRDLGAGATPPGRTDPDPARSRHRPGPGRPGTRREYYHQPDAPAVCFHASPLGGSPGGDQVETSEARWFTIGDISALPIQSAVRRRIDHALTPGRECHIG